MTLTLELTPDLGSNLLRAAKKRGLDAGQCAVLLLEERLRKNPEKPEHLSLDDDPLMAMAGADDFDPEDVDEVVYR